MGESAKSQISEKVRVAVITAIVLAALAYIGRSILLPILTAIWNPMWTAMSRSFSWLVGGVVETPAWLFCSLSGAALILLIVMVSKLSKALNVNAPNWTDYKTGSFFGMKWRWRYSSTGQVLDTTAFCPRDDTVLVYRKDYNNRDVFVEHETGITLHCETCGQQFGPFDGDDHHLDAKVKRQIDRKLRANEWQQEISQATPKA